VKIQKKTLTFITSLRKLRIEIELSLLGKDSEENLNFSSLIQENSKFKWNFFSSWGKIQNRSITFSIFYEKFRTEL
jgi:hypothetical protein